jgi:DNA-binding NarL/FixJ family response regulator
VPIRVFIVEDHPVVREGVAMLVASAPDLVVVGKAASGVEALARVAAAAPDVVLLDLDLGGEDGAALVPELALRAPAARVLVLTAVAQPRRHEGAVLAGARGLVHKSQETGLLLDAIRQVHAGELWFARELLDRALERSRPAGRAGAARDRLTERERSLVLLVAAGHRNAEIAHRLRLSEKTVRNQLSAIYGKLGVSDRMQLMIHAYRLGLALPPG